MSARGIGILFVLIGLALASCTNGDNHVDSVETAERGTAQPTSKAVMYQWEPPNQPAGRQPQASAQEQEVNQYAYPSTDQPLTRTQPARPTPTAVNTGWYVANNRGLEAAAVTPASIPAKVRQAYRAQSIRANRNNSFIVWASAWTRNGGSEGWAIVEHMTLEAVMAGGRTVTIHSQRYEPFAQVWGGWFPYNQEKWYRMGMIDENDFEVRTVDLEGGGRLTGAFINTGERTGDDAAAGHIWMKRWPRDEAPEGTVALRVTARFLAHGDCYINVGMDRYRLKDADAEPVQECLVSDTFTGRHGVVEVTMTTPDIEWQP